MAKRDEELPKFDLRSEDIAEARRQELLRIFPEVHTESGGVNFEALRLSLGDAVQSGPEIFGMSWPGKAECAKTIQKQSIATLLPFEEESVNWDTTQNVIIEGDNLEVLKVLQKAYLGKVKMIYIDPPYNTGNDFIYPDNYTESLKTYLQYTGQIDDEGRKFSTNAEAAGRFHSKWMNMMYPRLKLAADLLTDDGVVFISIDDSEVSNLRSICDEVFGQENFVANFIWRKKYSLSFTSPEYISIHEYVVCYRKNLRLDPVDRRWNEKETVSVNPIFKSQNPESTKVFRKGTRIKGGGTHILKAGNYKLGAQEVEYLQDAVFTDGMLINDVEVRAHFSVGQETLDSGREKIEVSTTGSAYLNKDSDEKKIRPISILFDYTGGDKNELSTINEFRKSISTRQATAEVEELLGGQYFDNPKPVGLIKYLVETFTSDGDVVLDFFAGSGTTAQSVMEFSCQRNESRKFVLIQLPEPIASESQAGVAGFSNIAEITRMRVRRAVESLSETLQKSNADLGFRSFRLSNSNFAVWDANAIEGDESKLEQQLFAQAEHVLPGRTNQDILFELMLKSRYELTTPVELVKVGKSEVWKVSGGEMVAIIDSGLTVEVIREVATWQPVSVVILDRCFGADDALKANARKIFEDSKVDLKTV